MPPTHPFEPMAAHPVRADRLLHARCAAGLALSLLCLVAAPVLAQPAAPTAALVTAVDVAQDAPLSEAMQRALRQAAGPMRVILEAGRTAGRRSGSAPAAGEATRAAAPVTGLAAPLVASPGGPAVVTARPALPQVVAATQVATVSVAAVAVSDSGPGHLGGVRADVDLPSALAAADSTTLPPASPAGRAAAPETEAAPLPESPIVAEVTMRSVLQAATTPGPVDAALAAPAVLPLSGAATAPAVPELLWSGPRLVNKVDPDLTPRWMEEALRLGSVWVELILRRDGSVASAVLPLSVPRPLARALQQSLEQWRYEPVPMALRHRVELVFGVDADQP